MLNKKYTPQTTEPKWYDKWESSKAFECDINSDKEPYTIMMPPPNVTGVLHIGHALTFSLQDILIRYYRLKGRDVLWQPGTDHAGIATQMVVERELAKEGVTRHELGREEFLKRVWQWKEQSGSSIFNQLRRLGATPDWKRERFTLDDGLSDAVRKVFVDLYNAKLLYRDKRLVNWDPKLHTAISDLEVDKLEIDQHFYHLRYPIADTNQHIIVATTRPETLVADAAVAVHPEDERYKDLIGKMINLPLTNRQIPIIADEHSDPELGTGAVKITPAHDFDDFEVGKRHDLPMMNILDQDAVLNENAPAAYQGLDRFEARKKMIADLEALDLVEEIEPRKTSVPHGQRSGVIIEPWLTDQWYVDAETLAKPALEAVRKGDIKFFPKQWENTYFDWLENIQPWCISRQLWWGHRIPIWYGPDKHVFCAHSEEEAHTQAKAHYGEQVELTQDEDVLDTWFSSALWPFSTLGWPEDTAELEKYYPTNVLVTGLDIIFFWVARMIMMGLYFKKDIPFKHVYVHALVRDEKGQKMSKSKGNVIDPLNVIDEYGADAMRFTLASLAAQGREIKLSMDRVEGNRNFVTKLWNAARFCEMNECTFDPDFEPNADSHILARWMKAELSNTQKTIDEALANYKFNDAANALYQFTWGVFCDWYLEFAKPLFQGDDENLKAEIRKTTAWVLQKILVLAHPFLPHVTEELNEQLLGSKDMLIISNWPDFGEVDETTRTEMQWVMMMITEIRAARAEVNIPPSVFVPFALYEVSNEAKAIVTTHLPIIKRLARLEDIKIETAKHDSAQTGPALQIPVEGALMVLPLENVIDFDKEKARLSKEIGKLDDTIGKANQKLSNQNFVERAPQEVVTELKDNKLIAETRKTKLENALKVLES